MLLILASCEFAIVLGFAGTALRSMTGSLSQRIPKVNFSAAGVGERDVVQQKLNGVKTNQPPPQRGLVVVETGQRWCCPVLVRLFFLFFTLNCQAWGARAVPHFEP